MDLSIVELEEILRWADIADDTSTPINRAVWSKLKKELNEQESY